MGRVRERIAYCDLYGQTHDALSEVVLQEVLDDLRIVIEPEWREIEGAIIWNLPAAMPAVLGERHGLLQAFLNLAKNSYRAVQDRDVRELRITVTTEGRAAYIRFQDSGPGISATRSAWRKSTWVRCSGRSIVPDRRAVRN